MILAKFVLPFLILLETSCTSIPKNQFVQLTNSPEKKQYDNLYQIVRDVKDILYTNTLDESLDKNDNVLLLPDIGIKYKSSFDLIKFTTKPQREYTLQLISKCDGFGFTKTIFTPIVIILGGGGNILNQKPEIFEQRDITSILPIHIYARWNVKSNGSVMYAIIASDNSIIGERAFKHLNNTKSTIASAIQLGLTGILIAKMYPIYSSPSGDYELQFDETGKENEFKGINRVKPL